MIGFIQFSHLVRGFVFCVSSVLLLLLMAVAVVVIAILFGSSNLNCLCFYSKCKRCIIYGFSAMLAEKLPQLCALCMATEPLFCLVIHVFIFCVFFSFIILFWFLSSLHLIDVCIHFDHDNPNGRMAAYIIHHSACISTCFGWILLAFLIIVRILFKHGNRNNILNSIRHYQLLVWQENVSWVLDFFQMEKFCCNV